MLRPVCLIALSCLFPAMPGCLIVVDHDHESHWSDDDGYVRARKIGVYLDSVGSTTASQLNLDGSQVTVIERVVEDSPADQAGLKAHDIITAVDGDTNACQSRVREVIRSHKPGETVTFTVLRKGQPQAIPVTVK